jgi:hypothetical protein
MFDTNFLFLYRLLLAIFFSSRLRESGLYEVAIDLCNPRLSGSEASRRSTLTLLDALGNLIESGNESAAQYLWCSVDLMPLSQLVSDNDGEGRRRRLRRRRRDEGEEQPYEKDRSSDDINPAESKHQQALFSRAVRVLTQVVMSVSTRRGTELKRMQRQLTRLAVASVANVAMTTKTTTSIGTASVQMLWTLSMVESLSDQRKRGGVGRHESEELDRCTKWFVLPVVTPMTTEEKFVTMLRETKRRREEADGEEEEEEVEEEESDM